jgi:hypothetical protein
MFYRCTPSTSDSSSLRLPKNQQQKCRNSAQRITFFGVS